MEKEKQKAPRSLLSKGNRYPSVEAFVEAIRNWQNAAGHDIKVDVKKTDHCDCCTVRCTKENCNFHLHLAHCEKKNDYYTNRSGKNHSCSALNNSTAKTADAIADEFFVQLLPHINEKDRFFKTSVMTTSGQTVNRNKARRVREALLFKLEADCALDYQKLQSLLESMKMANPTLQFEIERDDAGHFKRLNFATPNANAISLSGRPVYGVDGTWLHTYFKHNMIIATCLDAFNSIVVLGYCICSGENDENYNSFLRFLGIHVPSINREVSVVMSDRNASLVKFVAVHFPLAHQSFCADHIKKNILNLLAKVNLTHKKERVTQLWFALVRQRSKETFKSLLHAMREECPIVADYIEGRLGSYDKWATCMFGGEQPVPRYYRITSQFAESLNAAILPLRSKGILELVSGFFHWWCTKYDERRVAAAACAEQFGPNTNAIIIKNRERGEKLQVTRMTATSFFVKDGTASRRVDLSEKATEGGFFIRVASCDCGLAEESGIICAHITAVCKETTDRQTSAANAMSRYLLTDTQRATYSTANAPAAVPFVPAQLAADPALLEPLDVREDKRRKRFTAQFERVTRNGSTRTLHRTRDGGNAAYVDRLVVEVDAHDDDDMRLLMSLPPLPLAESRRLDDVLEQARHTEMEISDDEATNEADPPLAQAAPLPLAQAMPLPLAQAAPLPLAHAMPLPLAQAGPLPLAQAMPLQLAQPAPLQLAQPAPLQLAQPAPLQLAQAAPHPLAQPAPLQLAQPAPLQLAQPAPLQLAQAAPLPLAQPAPLQLAQAAPLPFAQAAPLPLAQAAPLPLAQAASLQLAQAMPLPLARAAHPPLAQAAPLQLAQAAPPPPLQAASLQLAQAMPLPPVHAPNVFAQVDPHALEWEGNRKAKRKREKEEEKSRKKKVQLERQQVRERRRERETDKQKKVKEDRKEKRAMKLKEREKKRDYLRTMFVGEYDYSRSDSEKELFEASEGADEEEDGEREKKEDHQEQAKRNRRKKAKKDPEDSDYVQ